LSLISLGLIAASRSSNEEVTIGLLNLVTWPMVLLSGIWFSLEGAPYWLQKAALALPMTHILNAARAVMIDGAGFAEVRTELLVLAGLTLVFLTIASMRFKWNED
jgi:ABC-type multidrug transport system permease subunit